VKILGEHSSGFSIGGGVEYDWHYFIIQKIGSLNYRLASAEKSEGKNELSYSKIYPFLSLGYTLFQTDKKTQCLKFEVQTCFGLGYSTPNTIVVKGRWGHRISPKGTAPPSNETEVLC